MKISNALCTASILLFTACATQVDKVALSDAALLDDDAELGLTDEADESYGELLVDEKSAEQLAALGDDYSAAGELWCKTISRNNCREVCLIKPRRPITIRGYASSKDRHPSGWTEINLHVYRRGSGREIRRDTVQQNASSVEVFVDVPAGDYRVVAQQNNRLATCSTTWANGYR